jgi:hypothetical protein
MICSNFQGKINFQESEGSSNTVKHGHKQHDNMDRKQALSGLVSAK